MWWMLHVGWQLHVVVYSGGYVCSIGGCMWWWWQLHVVVVVLVCVHGSGCCR